MWVMLGTYRLQLTAAGRTYERQFVVRMDLRVKTPEEDLGMQFSAAMKTVESAGAGTRWLSPVCA